MEDADKMIIVQALYDIRSAFARANVPCPDVMGYSRLDQARDASHPLWACVGSSEADGSNKVSMVGFDIRFDLHATSMEDDEIGRRVRSVLGIA